MFFICSTEVETLGDAFTHSWRVTARCSGGVEDNRTHVRPCSYREELEVHALVWTRGRNFRSTDVNVIFGPPPTAVRVAARRSATRPNRKYFLGEIVECPG